MRKQWAIAFSLSLTVTPVASCGKKEECPSGCPAPWLFLTLTVSADANAGAVSGVQATLSGPTTATLSCESGGGMTSCIPDNGDLVPGNYSLQVSAPGFDSTVVNATVVIDPDPSCRCDAMRLNPAHVTLNRARDKQDAAVP